VAAALVRGSQVHVVLVPVVLVLVVHARLWPVPAVLVLAVHAPVWPAHVPVLVALVLVVHALAAPAVHALACADRPDHLTT